MAIDACLAAYPTAFDENLRDGVASALRRSAIKDDRIFHAPVDFLEQSSELGAMYLAEYGDSRAVPALSRKLDALPVVDRDSAMMANHVFVEWRGPIESLGARLSAEQTARTERADARLGAVLPHRSTRRGSSEGTQMAPHRRPLGA